MSEVKKPAAKKSTGKGRTKPKKSSARKPAKAAFESVPLSALWILRKQDGICGSCDGSTGLFQ